jgi:prepilin-type N-terminal cleavage/methylation domain-containing protein
MNNLNFKKAFSLAEVLITLGVIGVVVALVMPNLVAKYDKYVTVQKLKKNYAIIHSAIKASIIDNGELDYWDYSLSSEDFAKKYILPYFKGATRITSGYNVTTMTNSMWVSGGQRAYYYLVDGTIISITTAQPSNFTSAATISVDLNGYKKPNRLGRDVFVYEISRVTPKVFDFYPIYNSYYGISRKIAPTRGYLTRKSETDYISSCVSNGAGYYVGESCGALIKYDGWKISDDYPW